MGEIKASRLGEWFNPQVLVIVGTTLVSVVMGYSAIKSDVRNIETLMREREQRQVDETSRLARSQDEANGRIASLERQRDELIELRADVKYIKQAVDKLP